MIVRTVMWATVAARPADGFAVGWLGLSVPLTPTLSPTDGGRGRIFWRRCPRAALVPRSPWATVFRPCGAEIGWRQYESGPRSGKRTGDAPDASAEKKKARDEAWQRWKALPGRI